MEHVDFRYGDQQILSNVSLRFGPSESIGIVGVSGAGKTTLLDVLTGLQPASGGRFLCDGVEFNPFTSRSMQEMIGYVPQSIALLDESISFNVSFEEDPDRGKVARALEVANLGQFISSLPAGVDTRVGENGLRISGGQRQRIGIARALYRSPRILVFDEATSSLDTVSERELTAEIEKLRSGVAVVIVAHRLSTVRACDRIYVMAAGRIAASGSHSELLRDSSIYRDLYQTQGHSESPPGSVGEE